MVLLYEVIEDKKMIDKKIEELKHLLLSSNNEDLAAELVALLDLRQSKLINIHRANVQSKMTIGTTEVDIATAVIIRNTIKEKIDYLTSLIESPECTLDKLSLMQQRDKHYSEYTLIDMGIHKNDLNVNLG